MPSSRQEEKERRRQERLQREQNAMDEARAAARVDKNRVLVGLPERLRKSNDALRVAEQRLEMVAQVYSQRLVLSDRVVLDNIGEVLNLPLIEGDDA